MGSFDPDGLLPVESGPPVADVPTPRPLTAEQVRFVKDCIERKAENINDRRNLVATVEQLRAEVDRLTADLATAMSAIADYKQATEALINDLAEARAAQPQEPT